MSSPNQPTGTVHPGEDGPSRLLPAPGTPAYLELLQQHHVRDLLLVLLGLLGLPVLLLGGVAVHGTYFEEAVWEERKASVRLQQPHGHQPAGPMSPRDRSKCSSRILLPSQQHHWEMVVLTHNNPVRCWGTRKTWPGLVEVTSPCISWWISFKSG